MNQFQLWYNRQPKALRTLIAINVVLYVAWQFLRWVDPVNSFVYNVLALNTIWPGAVLMPWQLVTYNFLHLGPGFFGLLHIAFNMLWLYWIGKEFERMHGSHELLALYLIGGLGGGLLSLLFGLIMPGFFGSVIHGASGAVLGVIMAVAILYPYKKIALIFLGTVKLLYLVLGFLAIDALLALSSSGVAVTAHWGGALAGFLCARASQKGIDVTSWARIFFDDSGSSRGSYTAQRHGRGSRTASTSSAPKMSFLDRIEMWLGGDPDVGSSSSSSSGADDSSGRKSRSRRTKSSRQRGSSTATASSSNTDEVDRILDKISEHGYESLSEEEKRILYEASQS
ncbi:MAG: rhomboid family intramembrane serine protease [Longimonas sp.]|uniref:rhomboid family intramembrane serine protease n=1 Tax=Longimonas sp. TaxID=2039626 RepID=UPI0033532EDD